MFNTNISEPFFICLNSSNQAGEVDVNPENEKILKEVNKNILYYYFCIDIKDYIFQKIDNRGLVTYAVLPKFICLKTFVPAGPFYESVLKLISGKYLFNRRLREYSEDSRVEEGQGYHRCHAAESHKYEIRV